MGYLPLHHHAVHGAEAALAQGDLMALFPQGWVWDRGAVRTWKPGAAILALHSGAPIIPLGIAGSDVAWPGSTLLPLPSPITLSFGKPLHFPCTDADRLPQGEVDAALATVRLAIEEQAGVAREQLRSHKDTRPGWLIEHARC